MTIRISTGTFNKLLGDSAEDTGANGLRGIFKYGAIELRTGLQPASADSAPTGTLLGVVTVNGYAFAPGAPDNGLTFATPVGSTLSKNTGDVWKFTALASGSVGWFRLKGNTYDPNELSTVLARIDGTCGLAGAGDLAMTVTAVTAGTSYTVDDFSITLSV